MVGSSAPSQEFVNAVNSYLKRYYPKNEMRPLGKNRFACALKWYKQIVDLAHKQNIEAKDIPQTVLTAMSLRTDDSSSSDQNRLTAEQLKDLQCLPEKLIATLADFQKVGVYWGAVTKKGRCLIADEPGLGKTIQSIGVATYFFNEWPLLVITPSSARCGHTPHRTHAKPKTRG